MDIKEKFEDFIAQYPIFEYRLLDTADIKVQERVRTICKQECERYGSTWACPPAVGTVAECKARCLRWPHALLLVTVAEVDDASDMAQTLPTRQAHEDITRKAAAMVEAASGHGVDDDEPGFGIGCHAALIFRECCAACPPGSRRTC